MKPYILLLGASVALAACDSRPTVTQPAAPPAKQELSAAEQDAIAEKVAQRLAQQREEESRIDAAREAQIREEVRREVEEEFARREAQQPPPRAAAEPAKEETPSREEEAPKVSAWGPDRVGYDMFYQSLSPYGVWYETADFGYVWQPTVASRNPSWRPYVDGQWADSDQGWVWVSQEPFGWATYHYGRWASLENIGWVWVPGNEWAPAWVSWREADDYVGWAPLPPRSIQVGASVGAWVDETYDIGPECYNFIPVVQFHVPTYRTVIVNHVENIHIIERTRNVTNIYIKNSNVYLGGPRADYIKGRCPGLIKTRPIARVNSREDLKVRGNGDTIVVYSPKVDRKEGRPQQVERKLDRPRVRTGWETVHDPTTKVRLQAAMAGKEVRMDRAESVVKQSDERSINHKQKEDRNDAVRNDDGRKDTVVTYEEPNRRKNEGGGRQQNDNNQQDRDKEEKGRQARENEERNRRDRENERRAQQAREDEERAQRDRENEPRAQQARENEERARRNRDEEEKRNRQNAQQAEEKTRQVARADQENKNKDDEEKKKRK